MLLHTYFPRLYQESPRSTSNPNGQNENETIDRSYIQYGKERKNKARRKHKQLPS